MTLIQPAEKNIIHIALFFMIAVLVTGSFWLILLYNRSVDLEHQISDGQAALRKLQSGKAELQDKIFTLLSDANLQSVSAERHLVKDTAPEYFKADQPITQSELAAGR